MGRMHSKGKGMSSSALPYKRSAPSWLKTTPQEVRHSKTGDGRLCTSVARGEFDMAVLAALSPPHPRRGPALPLQTRHGGQCAPNAGACACR